MGSKSNGKKKLKITSQDVDHLEMINGNWTKIYDNDVPDPLIRPSITKYLEIPCGQCIGCRLQRSREWANRMMMELSTTEGPSSFITLTYDNKNLPLSEGVNHITGEIEMFGNLVLEDLQKFMKRLREHTGKKIRYFACGEYGEKSLRPHYHLIVFGYFPEDAKFLRKGRAGEYNYYVSDELNKLWPYGLHVVSDVTWESCAYTARYVVKKFTGDLSIRYEEKNIKPPFVVMSNRPGIGYDYFMKNHDKFRDDVKLNYLSTDKGSIAFSKPRYFKKLDDLASFIPMSPETYVYISDKNADEVYDVISDQENERKIIELQTDLSYFEEKAVQGKYKEQQIKSLKRGIV